MTGQVTRRVRARGEQADADQQPGGPLRGDVEHRHEKPEEERGRADVRLEDQDKQAGRPGDQHRPKVTGPRQVDAEHPAAGQREHVPLGDQVAGEEYRKRQLGEFARLDLEAADDDPHLRAVDLAQAGRQQCRDGEQQQPERAEGVRVPLQHPRLPDHRKHRDEGGQANSAPHHLVGGRGRAHGADLEARIPAATRLLQPVDHHDAEAVQQRREWQHQRVGPWSKPPDGEVGGEHKHGERYAVLDHPGRQLAVQAEADAGIGGKHHAHREEQHQQLRAAPAAGHRGRRVGHGLCPGAGMCCDSGHPAPPCCGGQKPGTGGFGR